jgi:hypothetical protein
VLVVMVACAACRFSGRSIDDGGGSDDGSPRVLSISPSNGAIGVPLDGHVSATFSEAMDPATLNATTFTLTSAGVEVAGVVSYADSMVVFTPAAELASDGVYTATITTEVTSLSGVALENERTWSFTGNTVVAGIPVDLGTAGNYVVLAQAAISGTTATVTGDIAVSPAAATLITGFSLTLHGTFSSSAQVTGRVFAADYDPPTPANLTLAVSDMHTAFTAAAARAPDTSELGAGNVGGMNLAPGVYRWSSGVTIPTDLTLTGGATQVWIFQIAQDLTVASQVKIVLAGGAVAKHVFWQVSGAVMLGTMTRFAGVVLGLTSILQQTGGLLDGRFLSQTAVTIDGSAVVAPAL